METKTHHATVVNATGPQNPTTSPPSYDDINRMGPPPPGPPPVIIQPVPVAPMGSTVIYTDTGGTTIATSGVIVRPPMGPQPTVIVCRSCHQQIVTRIEFRAGLRTHLFAALLCAFGCWPCVCVPYCMDSCMNADHFCPNCSTYIGTYSS